MRLRTEPDAMEQLNANSSFLPLQAADSVATSVAAMKKIQVMWSTAQNDAHDYARRILR